MCPSYLRYQIGLPKRSSSSLLLLFLHPPCIQDHISFIEPFFPPQHFYVQQPRHPSLYPSYHCHCSKIQCIVFQFMYVLVVPKLRAFLQFYFFNLSLMNCSLDFGRLHCCFDLSDSNKEVNNFIFLCTYKCGGIESPLVQIPLCAGEVILLLQKIQKILEDPQQQSHTSGIIQPLAQAHITLA